MTPHIAQHFTATLRHLWKTPRRLHGIQLAARDVGRRVALPDGRRGQKPKNEGDSVGERGEVA